MSKSVKDSKILLGHVLESIEAIFTYTKGMTKAKFLKASKTQDAVIRRLTIIGEATNGIPDSFLDAAPEIPRRQIVGMRNMLIHEYLGVDMVLVWDTIKKDLPVLKRNILSLLAKN